MSNAYIASPNNIGQFYTDGPGFSYYGHTLDPGLSLPTQEDADRAARIANIAYKEGYKQAKKDIRKSLGIKS